MTEELSLDDLDGLFNDEPSIPTGNELSLADIDSLLVEEQSSQYKRHVRFFTHLPNDVDGFYVKVDLDGPKYPCTYPNCKINTHITVEGVPYCTGHISYPMSFIIKRLARQIELLKEEANENQ